MEAHWFFREEMNMWCLPGAKKLQELGTIVMI
jgi:hypothetical protein